MIGPPRFALYNPLQRTAPASEPGGARFEFPGGVRPTDTEFKTWRPAWRTAADAEYNAGCCLYPEEER